MKNLRFKLNIQFFAEDDPQSPAVDPTVQETPTQEGQPNQADIYAQALAQVKERTVDREEYEKVRAERDSLLKITTTQRNLHQQGEPEKIDLDQLRQDLFGERLTNYDFAEKSLKLRKGIMDAGGPDPFVSDSSDRREEDERDAKRVAQVLQECLDFCKDHHELFPSVLQSRLADDKRLELALAARRNIKK